MSKKKRTALVGQPHIKKPDIDNLEKAVLDSMSGAVLRDDCIVWWVEKKKFYVEQPFIRINLLTAQ
jgi:Holliday junction resolvase RusA-like endonuclease